MLGLNFMPAEYWPDPVQPVTLERFPSMIVAILDARMDALARSWGYDSKLSICTYALSAVPKFKAEADAFLAYRDALWTKAISDQAALMSGQLQPPESVAHYLATFPDVPERPQ